jgi:hypothetical protein
VWYMTLKEIRDMLLEVTPNSYHQEAWQQPDTYIVWAEDGESDAIHADNRKEMQILDVTIDVFTKEEYPEIITRLQDAFNEKDIPFKLLSIQYESDTKYTHYEYLIQAVM